MDVELPEVPGRLGLGVGMDMPWNRPGTAFHSDPDRGDGIPHDLALFFERYRDDFHYAFLAFQPKGCRVLQGIEALEFLLPRCPHLMAVTYEDPRFTRDGVLVPGAKRNYLRMRSLVAHWARES